ncbi:hypothetical protein BN8_p06908 (plasmid) [Fibrisoma limi BUZ 3]|uniref:Uncharacterized protein n=1 Tax=Fibrisoma limi BUZ 3 TaxID=1185876 RepID=I2GU98_9BACT|nr:hypothetical protein BN8_p06908 [Fibrisoma limi BUZ 3]
MNSPVYEEWSHRLVQSGHGPNTYYRVFKGTVNWSKSPGGMKPAIIVFIQYGKTEQWEKARGKEVALDLPAHILTEDLIYVLAAIQELE